MVGSCREPLTTFSFHIPFYRSFCPSLLLFLLARMRAKHVCIRVFSCGEDRLLIIVPHPFAKMNRAFVYPRTPFALPFGSPRLSLSRLLIRPTAICLRRMPFLSFTALSPFSTPFLSLRVEGDRRRRSLSIPERTEETVRFASVSRCIEKGCVLYLRFLGI